jgi:enterochelin esterase-like enzyme
MDSVLSWSLISGALPIVVLVAGTAALAFLIAAGTGRRWWARVVPIVLVDSLALVGAAMLVLAVLRPFPDPLPAVVWWSAAAVVVAVGIAGAAFRRPGLRRRIVVSSTLVLVLVAAANQVNVHFAQFPTVAVALGLPPANQVAFAEVATPAATVISRAPGQSLSAVWQAPSGMPVTGSVSEVSIPATVSGFAARRGWVYLPPSYLAAPRARLPVLVLLSGQPGNPRDWLDSGQLAMTMDRFAVAHGGLAPVVVMPDALGSALANPLCLDSRLGKVQTYLAVDVPAWVRTTLQVDPDPASWAVGGLSAGGTCAVQLAVNAAQVYPTFIDVSGQSEPTLGDRARTVGGAAFAAVNPLDVLATRRFPGTAGAIVVGGGDATYLAQAQQVARACQLGGMQIEYRELPGGHDWQVWAAGMQTSLPWLATRLHLTP